MTTPTLYNKTVTIEFEKLSYFASSSSKKSGQQPILDNVNGRFRPGYLAAILGPSGAGKTSLLNVLSGFKGNGSSVKGKILVNGRQRILQEFRKQSCYIRQEVAMHQLLTVKETFQIAACFKLSRKTSAAQRDRMVNDVAEILGLQSVMNSQVIFLSGGEKKRVSIGVELMNNPPVMFFDEPTSGLDSSSSYIVMKHLNSLAAKGRTVLVVIHQPSSRIFELIDDIYLLSKGSCLYNGPSKYLVETLAASNFHCPMYYNRSDFAIEVACNEREGNLESLKIEADNQFKQRKGEFYCDSPESLCNPSEDTCEHMAMLINEDESVLKNCDDDHIKKGSVIHHYPISRLQQFYLLFKRCLLCTGRNYQLAHIRVAMHILVAILLGFLYYDFGDDGDKVIGNFSFVFFIVLFIFFASAMPTVLTFPLEANVFLQEHLNNWYSVTVYYFAKVLADLPLQIICPTLFLMISYSLTGQPLEFNRMFMLWLVCVLIAILGQTLGNTFGAILDVQFAVFVVPASSIPMFLLSGYFQRPKDLSSVFRSLSYISYFKYAFEAALLSLFGYNRERLKCSEPYCHYRSTSKFLADTGVQDFCYWERLSALVGWIIGLQLLLYFTLKWKVYKSKR